MLVAHQTATVSLSEFLSMRIKVENFVLFGGFLLVWHIVFSSFGVYSSKRLSARWAEVLGRREGGDARFGHYLRRGDPVAH